MSVVCNFYKPCLKNKRRYKPIIILSICAPCIDRTTRNTSYTRSYTPTDNDPIRTNERFTTNAMSLHFQSI